MRPLRRAAAARTGGAGARRSAPRGARADVNFFVRMDRTADPCIC